MSLLTHEKLRKHIAEALNVKAKELRQIVEEIGERFRNLGLESAVWYPEKIYSANIGGLDADSYMGYSRIEGRWGLIIRTLEHDRESHAFVNQRVFTMESCGNVEIIMNALKKVPDLLQCIDKAVKHQIEILSNPDNEAGKLRNL